MNAEDKAADSKALEKSTASVDVEAPAPKKRNSCANLKLQLEIVQGNLSGGNNAQTAQKLKLQKQDIEKEMGAANCH